MRNRTRSIEFRGQNTKETRKRILRHFRAAFGRRLGREIFDRNTNRSYWVNGVAVCRFAVTVSERATWKLYWRNKKMIDGWDIWHAHGDKNMTALSREGEHTIDDGLAIARHHKGSDPRDDSDGETPFTEWQTERVKLLKFEPTPEEYKIAAVGAGPVFVQHDSGAVYTVVYDPRYPFRGYVSGAVIACLTWNGVNKTAERGGGLLSARAALTKLHNEATEGWTLFAWEQAEIYALVKPGTFDREDGIAALEERHGYDVIGSDQTYDVWKHEVMNLVTFSIPPADKNGEPVLRYAADDEHGTPHTLLFHTDGVNPIIKDVRSAVGMWCRTQDYMLPPELGRIMPYVLKIREAKGIPSLTRREEIATGELSTLTGIGDSEAKRIIHSCEVMSLDGGQVYVVPITKEQADRARTYAWASVRQVFAEPQQ